MNVIALSLRSIAHHERDHKGDEITAALFETAVSEIEELAAEITALRARAERAEAEVEQLLFALRTVLGDAEHGQKETWDERCMIGRDAVQNALNQQIGNKP